MPVKNSKLKKGEKAKVKNSALTAPTPQQVKRRAEGIQTDVYDLKGKIVEQIDLPKEIFGQKENKKLIAQAVRVYLANKRSGTASTKTRGEVNKTTAKVWRQKGTGRARHGAKSAPIWVGGGIAFGPKPRDYHLALPKKMRRKALFTCLSDKLRDGHIRIVAGAKSIEPKTKIMISVLEAIFPAKKQEKTVFVIDNDDTDNVVRAARNIRGVEVFGVHTLNAYDVLAANRILFLQEAIEPLAKQFVKSR